MRAEIRRAGADDVGAIAVVHVRSWQWAYRGLVPDAALDALRPEDREPGWRDALAPGSDHRVWVAESDGRAVGFAGWGSARDADLGADKAELYGLYVEREVAGSGVGGALMAEVLREMGAEGFARAVLWVLEANGRARRFYEKGGWVLDGGRKVVNLRGAGLVAVRYGRAVAGAGERA